jgi:hypothetical protein
MNLETAQEINKLMLECTERLNRSVQLALENSEPTEFAEYRKTVGNIMGQIFCDVLVPIYKKYPAVKPKELRHD